MKDIREFLDKYVNENLERDSGKQCQKDQFCVKASGASGAGKRGNPLSGYQAPGNKSHS